MKLSKRILAVMLACVMALCMLTACGGGGGGGSSSGNTSSGSTSTNDNEIVTAVNAALTNRTVTHDTSLDEKAQKYGEALAAGKDEKEAYAYAEIDYNFITHKGTELGGYTGNGNGLTTDTVVEYIVSQIKMYNKTITSFGYYKTNTMAYIVFKYE